MKVSKSVHSYHMDDAAFYYPTSLTADASNSLPSPPSSFYDKNSSDTIDSFSDGSIYTHSLKSTTTTKTTLTRTTTQDAQPAPLPQNYTIDHSFHTLSPAPPMLTTSYDSVSDNENMTIRHSSNDCYQSTLESTSLPLDPQHRYHQTSTTTLDLNDPSLPSEADLRSCRECGKIYKHPSCLYKHLWEHSEGWELTSKLPLTKHQQVQILEAATILVGMSTTSKRTVASLSSSSSASSLVDIQSVYRPFNDGDAIDNDQDEEMMDDGSDIISIVDDDNDPSSF